MPCFGKVSHECESLMVIHYKNMYISISTFGIVFFLTHERPVQHICCSDYMHIMQRRDLINFIMCMGQYSTRTISPKQRH